MHHKIEKAKNYREKVRIHRCTAKAREKKIGLCSSDLGTKPKTRLGHACRSGQLGSVTSKPNYGGASAKAPFAPREDDTSLRVYAKSFVNLRSKKLANSLS